MLAVYNLVNLKAYPNTAFKNVPLYNLPTCKADAPVKFVRIWHSFDTFH